MTPAFPRWPVLISVLGLTLVASDLALIAFVPDYAYLSGPARPMLALLTAVLLNEVSRVDRDAGRSVFDPAPGWGYWVWAGSLAGVVMVVLAAVVFGVLWLLGSAPAVEGLGPAAVPEALYRMCLEAPLVEEVFYRLALCGAVVALIGPRTAILVSGVVFAWLHWVYGNPNPENQVGGFILAWMYLRSGSLAVPITFHAAGNFLALLARVLAGYLWPESIPHVIFDI
jgi:membrane protease YdiL (CAAX protease family)